VAARPSTRDALLDAAEELLAAGRVDASVATITAEAGVGVGSFYNHFSSKESLFTLAAQRAFAGFESVLISQTEHIANPAERLCTRVRLFCRLPDSHPRLARIVVNAAPRSLISPVGYSPAFEADALSAAAAGDLNGADLDLKLLTIAAGAERLVGQAVIFPPLSEQRADDFAAVALQVLGMSRHEAQPLAHRPLADLVRT
jgi:AcrR family transcriptional regulator